MVCQLTVDEKEDPKHGMAFVVGADEMRERFNRTYRARLEAGHSIPVGRGEWVSMFVAEDTNVPSTVGGGIAIGKEPLLKMKLDAASDIGVTEVPTPPAQTEDAPLTIAEAKRRLAKSLGIDPEKIKIIIEA